MNVFRVDFDGGILNRSDGYGSFQVKYKGFKKRGHRLTFLRTDYGLKITNNVAEYLSLVSALLWLQSVKNKSEYSLEIYGDSQLVLNQLNGTYKIKKEHLKRFHGQCKNLLSEFASWKTVWHKRINNVRIFGH